MKTEIDLLLTQFPAGCQVLVFDSDMNLIAQRKADDTPAPTLPMAPDPPVPSAPLTDFAISAIYEPQLGKIIASANREPAEFRIMGLRDWSEDNKFDVPAYQVQEGKTFTVQGHWVENGQVFLRQAIVDLTAYRDEAPLLPIVPVAAGPKREGSRALVQEPTFSDKPGEYDLTRFGAAGPWPDGFVYCEFFRSHNAPLDDHFRQQQLVMQLSLTEAERSDESLRSRVYVEVTTGDLYHLQRHAAFLLASVSEVLQTLGLDGRYKGVDRVSFNFETTYAPNYNNYDDVLAQWPNAEKTRIVCECDQLKGRVLSMTDLWTSGHFHNEIAQRLINRHVALLLYVKAFCGPETLVTCGDGSVAWYVGLPQNDDQYEQRRQLNAGASFYDYFFTLPANEEDVMVNGIAVSPAGKSFWQVADWCNLYNYPKCGTMSLEDWTKAQNEHYNDYLFLWAHTNPSEEWYDVSIPAWFELNRKRLASMGRIIPISLQTHRFEEGIYFDKQFDNKSKHFGLDEAICPPWHNYSVAALTRMCAIVPRSGLTSWSTVKQWPSPVFDSAINDSRPQSDRLAYRAALADLYQFREFFDPANRPVLITENLISYPNDATYKRQYANEVARNPATPNSANVVTRIINENGVWRALVVATNWRQQEDQSCDFRLLISPDDVPGLLKPIFVDTLTIKGRWPLIVEPILI